MSGRRLIIPADAYRPPGRDAPIFPTLKKQKAVKRMLRQLAHDVYDLDESTVRKLLPALNDARKEVRKAIGEWLRDIPEGGARYTAQHHRRALVSIQGAMDSIGDIQPRLMGLMVETGEVAGHLAADHLRFELARMANVFGGPGDLALVPTQIDTAAVVADGKRELIPRFRASSHRYSRAVRADLRHQFGVGLARGETFAQMTNRLRRLGGPRGMVALRGVMGEPGALVQEISEGLFRRYRHWAERLVRTETINAYNSQHLKSIKLLNEDLDDGEEPFLVRWDATFDRVCPICRYLDRRTVEVGQPFIGPGGQEYRHPPAHPNCRCTVVAWHRSWGGIKGEVGALEG